MRTARDATLAAASAPRRLLAALLLVLAATAPTAAHAFTLTELLQMPLERLLQLHIETR
jgi:hypothetical protein